jgi:hypothetical protein
VQQGGPTLHVIGVGSKEDWEAGLGSLFYIEDGKGETSLPVFTTAEKAGAFVQANFDRPEAHMQMLESIGVFHAPPLMASRFVLMPMDQDSLTSAAATDDADYLIRDPRPGDHQEILRFTE